MNSAGLWHGTMHREGVVSDMTMTYGEALNRALREEMDRDDRVFLLGQGIADRGGSFKVTAGLLDRFGPIRVIDTPIAEASTTGMAVGAAVQGKRPIVELTFIDFSLLAMDMLINQAAKYAFISNDRRSVPMVVRTQGGIGSGLASQHSQSLEAIYYHIPGLKLVMPATPADAYGLLKSAVRDDDPVIFIEHKALYSLTGSVSANEYTVPLGSAATVRSGSDCTVVTYSRMVHRACDAADILTDSGLSCDVIDLRSLVPMDRDTIRKSVEKTGRLVVVTEAAGRGSVASDIAAWAGENLFDFLKAPVKRVAGMVTPVPYSAALEPIVIPLAENIAEVVRAVCG